ncbi:helix-turn-helix domain-containing protein [uncultured Chryseobacterium sp.]|uniref:helix-turn-helix domain-containing protein n=1 Tax=uncultured Chryseobacterium sp. TaxID=259322 RepID=UPI0025F89AF9|nr:helix-turn-helix domain-containing protein [uncultured Chryseobacterium sp.]
MQYIVIIGAFQALVALWLLQVRDKKSSSSYLFMCLLLAIAAHLTIKFVIFNFIPDERIRHEMNTFIGASYGPLIYLYALSKTQKDFSAAKKWYAFIPLFILMIAYLTVSCVFFVLNRTDQTLLSLYNNLSLYSMLAINLYYPLKSLLIVHRYKTDLLNMNEYGVIVRISWCILFMESTVVIGKTFLHFYPEKYHVINISARIVVYFLLLIICLLIIRKNLKTGMNDPFENPSDKNLGINDIDKEELALNYIDYEIKFSGLWQNMDRLVRQKQLYRDCDLNLDKLALQTEINKYQISEMLNGYKQKPFYRYINEYRIEYFKNMLEQAIEKDENINFLSFAYEAGFKSKSSFNRYFKEITGKTPSLYYKSIIGGDKPQSFEISI